MIQCSCVIASVCVFPSCGELYTTSNPEASAVSTKKSTPLNVPTAVNPGFDGCASTDMTEEGSSITVSGLSWLMLRRSMFHEHLSAKRDREEEDDVAEGSRGEEKC